MVVPKPNPTKEKLLKLMSDKDKLEAKIGDYGAVLVSNGNVGLNGPLIDGEGFPRNDIDVHQVRQARQQIICLQNDHKELMKQIEELLHQLHAEQKQLATLEQETTDMQIANNVEDNDEASAVVNSDAVSVEMESPLTVIAVVNILSSGSPAEEAGLRVGDEILQFGTINSRNLANDLKPISNIVRHMENQRIALKVQRKGEILDMILIPKVWNGRGLMGCNIVQPSLYIVER